MGTWTTTVKLDGVDVAQETVEGVSISYGRQSISAQPEPTTVSLTLLRDTSLGAFDLATIRPGTKLSVVVTPEYVISSNPGRTRFFGFVTDVSATQDTINVVGVNAGLYVLRQLRTTVPDGGGLVGLINDPFVIATYFYEYVGVRAIDPTFTMAGGLPQLYGGPAYVSGAWYLPALGTDGYVAGGAYSNVGFGPLSDVVLADILNTLAAGAMGTWYEDFLNAESGNLDGYMKVVYAPDLARDVSLAAPDLTLAGDEVEWAWNADLDLATYVTGATVTYNGNSQVLNGDVVEFNNAGTVEFNAPASALVGAVTRNTQTVLYSASSTGNRPNATDVAVATVGWGAQPGYVLDANLVMSAMTGDRMRTVCDNLLVGRLWETPTIATGLPTSWFLEGYTESIGRRNWTIRVKLSDVRNSWYGQTWDDVTATLQWDQVGATVTWLDLQGEEL